MAAKTALHHNGHDDLVETLQANLYLQSDVDKVINQLKSESRHIKYLVNAAGYFKPKTFIEHTTKDYDAYALINRVSFLISQSVIKNMIENGGGSVIYLGSMWAKQAI